MEPYSTYRWTIISLTYLQHKWKWSRTYLLTVQMESSCTYRWKQHHIQSPSAPTEVDLQQLSEYERAGIQLCQLSCFANFTTERNGKCGDCPQVSHLVKFMKKVWKCVDSVWLSHFTKFMTEKMRKFGDCYFLSFLTKFIFKRLENGETVAGCPFSWNLWQTISENVGTVSVCPVSRNIRPMKSENLGTVSGCPVLRNLRHKRLEKACDSRLTTGEG